MKTLGVNWIEQSNLTKQEKADVFSKIEDISFLDKAMHFFSPEEVLHSGYLLPIILSETKENLNLNGFEMAICFRAKGVFDSIEQDLFLINCVGSNSEIEIATKAKKSGNAKELSEVVKIAQKYTHLLVNKPTNYSLALLPLFRVKHSAAWRFGDIDITVNKNGEYLSSGNTYTSLETAFKNEVAEVYECNLEGNELRGWLEKSTLTNAEKLKLESNLSVNFKDYEIKPSLAIKNLTELLTAEEALTCRLPVLLSCATFAQEMTSPNYIKEVNTIEIIAMYNILKAKEVSTNYGFKHVSLLLAIGGKENVELNKKLFNYKTKGKAFQKTLTHACSESDKIYDRLIQEKAQCRNENLGLIGNLYSSAHPQFDDVLRLSAQATKNRETYTIGDHLVIKTHHEWLVFTINPTTNEVEETLQSPKISKLNDMLAFVVLTYEDLVNKKHMRSEQQNALDEVMTAHQSNIDENEMEAFKETKIFGCRLDLAIEHAKCDAHRRANAIISKTNQLESKVRKVIEDVMVTGDLSKISSDITNFYPDITESLYRHFYKASLPNEEKQTLKRSSSEVRLRFPNQLVSDGVQKKGPYFIQLN